MKVNYANLFSKVLITLAVIIVASLTLAVQANAEQTEEIIGDLYADKEITIKDAIFLKQYLNGKLEIPDEKLYMANTYVEDNGRQGEIAITGDDVYSILKYLTKKEETLGVGEWRVLQEPTEDTAGKAERRVAKGIQELELGPLSEENYSVMTSKRASCTEQGEERYRHKIYREIEFRRPVAMLEHKLEIDEEIAPTCTENGKTQGSHCSRCNTIITPQEEIPATGHSFADLTWKCSVCESNMYNEQLSYEKFSQLCNVTEANNIVTLHYNRQENVGINLYSFNLDPNKTYVFFFGADAGNVKFDADGNTYGNVRIEIGARNKEFNLNLQDVGLVNYRTVIHSLAQTLNLGFYGEACSISTTKGIDGANGKEGDYIALSEMKGNDGEKANTAIYCGSGVLNIACGANTSIVGGNGGNGGNGGDYVFSFPASLGGNGGKGGNGGDGATAIEAGAINAFFVLDKTRDNLYIVGGTGGNGGMGGNGAGLGGVDGEAGQPGASASGATVEITYVE